MFAFVVPQHCHHVIVVISITECTYSGGDHACFIIEAMNSYEYVNE